MNRPPGHARGQPAAGRLPAGIGSFLPLTGYQRGPTLEELLFFRSPKLFSG